MKAVMAAQICVKLLRSDRRGVFTRYISYDFGQRNDISYSTKRTRGVMIGTYRPFKLSCVIRDRYPCSLGYQSTIGPLAQLVRAAGS